MGTLQFVTGVAVMLVVSSFLDGTAVPMVAGIAGCAIVAFVLTHLTLRPGFAAPAAAAAD
jgi:MFS transporter, DHA1 family, multidrug resistance protein